MAASRFSGSLMLSPYSLYSFESASSKVYFNGCSFYLDVTSVEWFCRLGEAPNDDAEAELNINPVWSMPGMEATLFSTCRSIGFSCKLVLKRALFFISAYLASWDSD